MGIGGREGPAKFEASRRPALKIRVVPAVVGMVLGGIRGSLAGVVEICITGGTARLCRDDCGEKKESQPGNAARRGGTGGAESRDHAISTFAERPRRFNFFRRKPRAFVATNRGGKVAGRKVASMVVVP